MTQIAVRATYRIGRLVRGAFDQHIAAGCVAGLDITMHKVGGWLVETGWVEISGDEDTVYAWADAVDSMGDPT